MRFVFMRRLSSIELNIDVLKKYSRYPLVTCYSIPISHKILCWNKNYNKQDALLLLIPTELIAVLEDMPQCDNICNAKRSRRDLVDLALNRGKVSSRTNSYVRYETVSPSCEYRCPFGHCVSQLHLSLVSVGIITNKRISCLVKPRINQFSEYVITAASAITSNNFRDDEKAHKIYKHTKHKQHQTQTQTTNTLFFLQLLQTTIFLSLQI